LAFIQGSSDVVQMLASNSSLDISVTGGGDDEAPIGIVFRWGPAENGAVVETSSLESDEDTSYSIPIGQQNIAVLGAGFDGSAPDPDLSAGFETNAFAIYSRRISNLEVTRLLDYAETRLFTSPTGDHYTDCTFDTDDFGWIDA
jgi:hypothetical protein